MPKNLSLVETISSCEQESTNIFATHFSSGYNCEEILIENSVLESPTFDLPNDVSFSVDDVYHDISTLRGVWSVGFNGLCN